MTRSGEGGERPLVSVIDDARLGARLRERGGPVADLGRALAQPGLDLREHVAKLTVAPIAERCAAPPSQSVELSCEVIRPASALSASASLLNRDPIVFICSMAPPTLPAHTDSRGSLYRAVKTPCRADRGDRICGEGQGVAIMQARCRNWTDM